MRILCCLIFVLVGAGAAGAQQPPLADSLRFHASFDESADADFARGDSKVYTARSLKRDNVQAGLHSGAVKLAPKGGRYGGCLSFSAKSEQIILFKGQGNLPSMDEGFEGTYSFWLRLTPDEDLPPGYVDPLQITDKTWNDAAFFVDFTKEAPRSFRLGAYSDLKFWNPQGRKYEEIPDSERPLVTVAKPVFSREKWTHVGISFRDFNQADKVGRAALYVDGESMGELRRKQQFTWAPERLAIMLGIYYVGDIDDFAVFDRALTGPEIQQVLELRDGVKSLGRTQK